MLCRPSHFETWLRHPEPPLPCSIAAVPSCSSYTVFRVCSVLVFLPFLLYSTVVYILHFTVWRPGLPALIVIRFLWPVTLFCKVAATLSAAVHSTLPPAGYLTCPPYAVLLGEVVSNGLLLTFQPFEAWLALLLPHTRSVVKVPPVSGRLSTTLP